MSSFLTSSKVEWWRSMLCNLMKYNSRDKKRERKEWDKKTEISFSFTAYYMISQYAAGKGLL